MPGCLEGGAEQSACFVELLAGALRGVPPVMGVVVGVDGQFLLGRFMQQGQIGGRGGVLGVVVRRRGLRGC